MVFTAVSEFFWFIVISYVVVRIMKFLYIVSMSVYGHFIKKPMDITNLLDKWCVITGCTDGIGRAYIDELAKTRGIRKFYLIARNQQKLDKVKEEMIRDHNAEIKTAIFDFESCDYSTLPAELATLPVGILVNCVGIAPDRVANFYELPHDLPSRILRVNLMSCMHMIETILPGMIERDAGVIVNVSSVTGWRPLPYMSTYPASKAAMSFYSDTLTDEFHHTNVRVTCLIPLLVATKIASYNTSEANDIFVIRPETYARYAVNILGNFRISTGCFFHDIQIALGTLISFWGFKQIFVPTVLLGIHKKRVESFQVANSKKE